MKKSIWLVNSIVLMSLATASAMAADSKVGENRDYSRQSVSDTLDKKTFVDPIYSRLESPPPETGRGCPDGDAGDWCGGGRR